MIDKTKKEDRPAAREAELATASCSVKAFRPADYIPESARDAMDQAMVLAAKAYPELSSAIGPAGDSDKLLDYGRVHETPFYRVEVKITIKPNVESTREAGSTQLTNENQKT